MNEINNNIVKKFQNLISGNIKILLIILTFLLILVVVFQVFNYTKIQRIKNSSVDFFNYIENSNLILENLDRIEKNNNFFLVLSKLKIIEKLNQNNEFSNSNNLYKELINNKKLNNLYISTIAAHASYTLIDGSYKKNTSEFFSDIEFYINKIDDSLENFLSIKKELTYLLIISKIDINKNTYKNNIEALDLYNEIINSDIISTSVKERVKKIHEFQYYQ